MKEFVEFIAKHLVDNPEGVTIEETKQENDKIVFVLKVAPNDVGKVIGRHGKTAQAIRILLTAVSAKEKKRAMLEILD